MIAEVGSFQFEAGKYNVMIKIMENDQVVYWAQRCVSNFDINNCEQLKENCIQEYVDYIASQVVE